FALLVFTSSPLLASSSLSLHDALPISTASLSALGTLWRRTRMALWLCLGLRQVVLRNARIDLREQLALLHLVAREGRSAHSAEQDRKSTRLNSSHQIISYAVFCLKKKK